MLVRSVEAVAFGTNCYVVAPASGEECVIVDPGIGVADRVADVLRTDGLRPLAVLLTHGHLDHVYDVPGLTQRYAAPAGAEPRLPSYIHSADRYRLVNPVADLDAGFVAMMEAQFGQQAAWTEPEDVIELDVTPARDQGPERGDSVTLSVAGLSFEVRHAPGHTEGSVLLSLHGIPDAVTAQTPLDTTMLSGDVLFAGSIGRCDLPGGDPAAMTRSLRDVVLPLPDSTLVLPGHGPATTMAAERANNPYLRSLLV